jgi:F-box/leucine-rich repeat protein 10/11
VKRRRVEDEGYEEGSMRFRNFKPRVWDRIEERVEDAVAESRTGVRPGGDEGWSDVWVGTDEETEGGEEAQVGKQRTVVVKVRRSGHGVERQRIERVVEKWTW